MEETHRTMHSDVNAPARAPFLQTPESLIDNRALSDSALRLLQALVKLPPRNGRNSEAVARALGMGRDKTNAARKSLRTCGHWHARKRQHPGSREIRDQRLASLTPLRTSDEIAAGWAAAEEAVRLGKDTGLSRRLGVRIVNSAAWMPQLHRHAGRRAVAAPDPVAGSPVVRVTRPRPLEGDERELAHTPLPVPVSASALSTVEPAPGPPVSGSTPAGGPMPGTFGGVPAVGPGFAPVGSPFGTEPGLAGCGGEPADEPGPAGSGGAVAGGALATERRPATPGGVHGARRTLELPPLSGPLEQYAVRAEQVLVALRQEAPQLPLTPAQARELARIAGHHLLRGETAAGLRALLTQGLPPDGVRCPRAFVRGRLVRYLPPEPAPSAGPGDRPEPSPRPDGPVARLLDGRGWRAVLAAASDAGGGRTGAAD